MAVAEFLELVVTRTLRNEYRGRIRRCGGCGWFCVVCQRNGRCCLEVKAKDELEKMALRELDSLGGGVAGLLAEPRAGLPKL